MKPQLIIIVDDDKDDCEILATTFCRNYDHISILTFNNGTDFLAFINQTLNIPSFIILDLYMPVMDGLEIIEVMKNQESTRHIPIVLLSTITNEIAKKSVSVLENVRYMIKPISFIEYCVLTDNIIYKTVPL